MTPEQITGVEQLLGFVIAFLTALGIWNIVGIALTAWILLGLTMRVLDSLGGKS